MLKNEGMKNKITIFDIQPLGTGPVSSSVSFELTALITWPRDVCVTDGNLLGVDIQSVRRLIVQHVSV